METAGDRSLSRYERLVTGERRTVQDRGDSYAITLPAEFCRDHGLTGGDNVAVERRDGELVVVPPDE
jgi:antitoxin component of MazEF toxin-antitoxin module